MAQTFIVGFDAKTPKSKIEKVVSETHIGGIYLTDTNDAVADGFTPDFYHHLSELAGAPMIIAMDDEGGEIARNAHTGLPSAKQLGKMPTADVEAYAKNAAEVLRRDGVTLDLAPDNDLDNGLNNGAISKYDRSFSVNHEVIADKSGAFVDGLQSGGVTAVLKHFPGIGYASPDSDTDSHKAVSPPLSWLAQHDLVSYETQFKNNDIKVVMLSNEYVTGLDSTEPASISPAVVQYLRNMGFRGVITTDALSAIAKYDGESLAQNIADSVHAGVNMPLFGYTDTAAILKAIRLTEETVSHTQVDDSYKAIQVLKQEH